MIKVAQRHRLSHKAIADTWHFTAGRTCSRLLSLEVERKELPKETHVVIAGGGAVGCSVAYHLGKLGVKDVVLLEQGSIGCGTSWHAAGLVGALKGSVSTTKLAHYATQLFPKLEEDTDQGTGFKKCGSLQVAITKDRAIALRRVADLALQMGIECHEISPTEAKRLWGNLLNPEGLEMALWTPNDGVCTSSDVCNAYVKGAKQNGVQIFEKIAVQKVVSDGKRVIGVDTDRGYIKCENFVNSCGQWSREMGMKSNPRVHIPLHSCEHFYIVTKPMPGVFDMLPVLRDPDARVYIREWSGGLMAGGFEAIAKPCFYDKIPDGFEFGLLAEDWPHFTDNFMDGLMWRIPSMETAEIRQFLNGPESFTDDGTFILGETPEIKNYYVAAAMNSNGIVCSAGVGKIISELITEGSTSFDITSMDVQRLPQGANNKLYLKDAVKSTLGRHYGIPYPRRPRIKEARVVKTSPLYETLNAAGAEWMPVGLWERADWFNVENSGYGLTFGKPGWLTEVETEYYACRNGIGLADTSWQSILRISGERRSLVDDMQRICASDIDISVDAVVHTALLNKQGCYVGIVKLIRTDEDSFLVIVSPDQETKFRTWFEANCESSVRVDNLSEASSIMAVLGPGAEGLLASLSHPDECISGLKSDCSKVLDVGYASDVRLVRGYLGSADNWELLVPSQYCTGLYKMLMAYGKDHGIKNVGHYAMEIIRSKHKIPKFGVEISRNVRAFDIHPNYYVDFDKPENFIGKDADSCNQTRQLKKLWTLEFPEVDESCWVWGAEPILSNGEPIGNLISATWDPERKKLTGLALLGGDIDKSSIHVLVAGVKYNVTIS